MADINNSQPLVTVGICCYNRREGFKNSLDYICGQTYQNLEIIVSQDFNTQDDYTDIITAANDNRIIFHKQQQRLSMYNNFSFLLKKATGEYFMWAADDDWWGPEFVEEVMALLQKDPSAVAGCANFMEVDEDNNRITSYPDHLPLLTEFTVTDDVIRLKNYINQFEGFGKANLFYSIFRTKNLRIPQVFEILKSGDLPSDMLINFTVLTQGKLVVCPQILKTCTVGNIKSYTEIRLQPKMINLLIFKVNFNGIKDKYRRWAGFISYHFTVINRSGLPVTKKIALYPTLIKKVILFYYDLVCAHIRLRGYDIFSKMQRKHMLN